MKKRFDGPSLLIGILTGIGVTGTLVGVLMSQSANWQQVSFQGQVGWQQTDGKCFVVAERQARGYFNGRTLYGWEVTNVLHDGRPLEKEFSAFGYAVRTLHGDCVRKFLNNPPHVTDGKT